MVHVSKWSPIVHGNKPRHPATLQRQPTQDNADDPTTSLCEGDQSLERLASPDEGYVDVSTNTTTTRPAPTNIMTAKGGEEETTDQYIEMFATE